MRVPIPAGVTQATNVGQATSDDVTVSLVLQEAGQLPTTDFLHVVVSLKWVMEQYALLHASVVIESKGPPLVAAVIMEYGFLVQDLNAN